LDIPVPFNLTLEAASVPQKPDIVTAVKRCIHQDNYSAAAE
jgi:pyruvate/2-oxoglutarate/acetoin dehydrogenase E1 component